ncbi:MAG: 4Fe-4S binding protein [Coriobacteriia bacterium]|nr:4Fe-4S binding protein [Coriobacteriia bacterium]
MRIWGTGVLKSMRIAFRNFMRPNITVQYPHERVELPERSRWALAMKLDEAGAHKCTGCMACEKACPDFIIKIEITTGEDRSKHIDHWHYEVGACMMCGLCVEACTFDAIEMSHDYELARIDPSTLAIELLADTPVAVAKKRAPVAPAAEPASAAASAAAEAAADTVNPAPATAEEGCADA